MSFPCTRFFSSGASDKKENDMNEKIRNLERHIANHPKDYQAVIGLVKARSDAIEHSLYQRKITRLKRVAEFRRVYDEKHSQH